MSIREREKKNEKEDKEIKGRKRAALSNNLLSVARHQRDTHTSHRFQTPTKDFEKLTNNLGICWAERSDVQTQQRDL